MPKDNIERDIKKALDKDTAAIYQPTYEGYAPGGVAVFVEAATDNSNRTVGNIRAIFAKNDGNLATTGSVDDMLDRKGIFVLKIEKEKVEEIELDLVDGGVEEIEYDEEMGELIITVAFEDFGNMQDSLENLSLKTTNANLDRRPHVS